VETEDKTPFEVNPDILWDSGFRSLTRTQVTDLLAEIMDTLETRVGFRLSERLDRNQIAVFDRIVRGLDQRTPQAFLVDEIPDFREVVRSELEAIVGSIRRSGSLRKLTDESSVDEAPSENEESTSDDD